MANQSQPRPRFRFGPMVRPILPPGPPPSPAPSPAPAPLPRPSMIRPPFRPPVAVPPQLAQAAAAAPPQLGTRIADTSTGTRKSPPRSPATRNSPHASPITRGSPAPRKSPLPAPSGTQKSLLSSPVTRESFPAFPTPQKSPLPATPVTRKSPPSPSSPVTHSSLESPTTKKSPLGSRGTENYSSSKPKTQSPRHSVLSSPRATKPLSNVLPASSNINPAPHSPPSFSLPPSQLQFEREIPTIAEQKTVNPRSFPKPERDNPKNSSAKEQQTKRGSNPEDIGMKIITISGENRGAVMELRHSPGTHSTPHQLSRKGESSQGNSSRKEGRSKHAAKAIPSQPMHSVMNSNVQGINSSVVFNSTLSFHDPGVRFRLSRKPDNGHLNDHANDQNSFSD